MKNIRSYAHGGAVKRDSFAGGGAVLQRGRGYRPAQFLGQGVQEEHPAVSGGAGAVTTGSLADVQPNPYFEPAGSRDQPNVTPNDPNPTLGKVGNAIGNLASFAAGPFGFGAALGIAMMRGQNPDRISLASQLRGTAQDLLGGGKDPAVSPPNSPAVLGDYEQDLANQTAGQGGTTGGPTAGPSPANSPAALGDMEQGLANDAAARSQAESTGVSQPDAPQPDSSPSDYDIGGGVDGPGAQGSEVPLNAHEGEYILPVPVVEALGALVTGHPDVRAGKAMLDQVVQSITGVAPNNSGPEDDGGDMEMDGGDEEGGDYQEPQTSEEDWLEDDSEGEADAPSQTTMPMKMAPQGPPERPGLAGVRSPSQGMPSFGRGGQVAHPGFKSAQAGIAQREGVSSDRAGAILAAATRRASPEARAANPRLNRVK